VLGRAQRSDSADKHRLLLCPVLAQWGANIQRSRRYTSPWHPRDDGARCVVVLGPNTFWSDYGGEVPPSASESCMV
jgi:hypothetical protein